MKKVWRVAALLMAVAMLFSLLGLAGCAKKPAAESEKMKVAFMDFSSSSGSSWVVACVKGAEYAEAQLPWLEATKVESVAEDPGCVAVIRQLAQDGNRVVFTNGYGFAQFLPAIADEFKDTIFIEQQGVPEDRSNIGSYYGYHTQGRYLTGVVAGLTTKSDKIGFVAGFAFPPVIAGVNAFALGVQSVNPDAKVQVAWVNSWYDPAKEKEAADSLINAGCDIVASHTDSDAVLKAAAAKDKLGITSSWSWAAAAPDAFLTSMNFNWGKYYVQVLTQIKDGTWQPARYMGSVADGVVDIAPLGPGAAPGAQASVDQAKADIISGAIKLFTGPIKDNEGTERVAAGQILSEDDALNTMDWLVEGVIGSTK